MTKERLAFMNKGKPSLRKSWASKTVKEETKISCMTKPMNPFAHWALLTDVFKTQRMDSGIHSPTFPHGLALILLLYKSVACMQLWYTSSLPKTGLVLMSG